MYKHHYKIEGVDTSKNVEQKQEATADGQVKHQRW